MDDQDEIKKLIRKLESALPVCRICLNDTLEYIDLETSLCVVDDNEVTYLDGYKEFTRSALLGQNLPSRLCITCANNLCNAFMFLRRVENAERILKRIKSTMDGDNESLTIVDNAYIKLETEVSTVLNTQPQAELESEMTTNILYRTVADIKSDNNETEIGQKSIDPDTCFQCKDCGKICKSPESYRKHCIPHQLERCKTKTRKSIKCKQCGKTFKLYADLEKHLLIHAMAKIQVSKRGKMTYECNACHKKYQTVFAFIDHMHIHNGTKPYKCSICGAFRHTRSKLKSHKYHSHGKGFENRIAVKDEKMRFMETEPLRFKKKCRYCGKLVVNEVIKRHEKMHENPERRFRCLVCGKTFYTEQNLQFHSETHLEVRKPFKCTICGQEILRKYSLKLHMQRHASEDKKFKCDICGAVLSAKSTLTEHRAKHFFESKYKCEYCEKTFIRKSRLVYHIRIHTGEKPFECKQCDKSFKMAARLRSHVRVAHANQTYNCDQCDSKFKSYNGFKNHQFMHKGFPFNCPQCNKGLPNRERLKKHLLQVHKGFMSLQKFNEVYPKKSETKKVQKVSCKEERDVAHEMTVDVHDEM